MVEQNLGPGPGGIRAAHVDAQPAPWQRLAFLVPPQEVADWRMVLLFDAAVDHGLLAALPGQAAAIAADRGLDHHAVRVVLDGLALWEIVVADDDGAYALGPAAPGDEATAMLRHHAGAIRRFATITGRVGGVRPDPSAMPRRGMEIMLDAMAVRGRESAPGAVDACLAAAPDATSVIDLGGGHGQFAAEFARRGLRAVMQDRPEVIEVVRRKDWLDGAAVELFAGDFFESVPDDAFDIVFCAGVAYTMSGERLVRLLRTVRPLVAPGGLLAVHTFLRDTDELATLFLGEMLAVTDGGPHREVDLRRWAREAGYTVTTVERLGRRPEWMLFAVPDGA